MKISLATIDSTRRDCPIISEHPLFYLVENNEKSVIRICVEMKDKNQLVSISLPKIVIPIDAAPTLKVLEMVGESISNVK